MTPLSYVAAGYWAAGYENVVIQTGEYVDVGYWDNGYVEGSGVITTTATTGSNKRRPQIQWLPAHVPYIATPPRQRPRKKRDAELLFLGR